MLTSSNHSEDFCRDGVGVPAMQFSRRGWTGVFFSVAGGATGHHPLIVEGHCRIVGGMMDGGLIEGEMVVVAGFR